MKHKIFNTLKHKLQWLVIASALLGVSQGVWGSNEVHGNFSGSWADTDISSMTASITMNAGTYQFGIRYGGTWYSKTNLIIARNKNVTDQDLETNNGNITLNADVSGTYTFKLKDNNGKPRLSVTFPSSGSVDYVLVGDAALNGIGWQNTNSNLIMSGTPKSITFSNVAALPSVNNVNFRIVPYNTWETSIGWNQWDGDTSDLTNTTLTAKGSDNNIKIATTSTLNITITYNGSSIHVATEVPCTAPTAKSVYIGGSSATTKTICSTSNTYVRLASSQNGYSYQLKRQNGDSWDNVGAAWSSTGTGSHDFTGLSTAGTYKITGYPTGNSSSCNQDMSNTVTLSVDDASVAGSITGAGAICSGESKTLGVSGNTGTVTQWKNSAAPNGTYSDISGATEPTYSASPVSTTYYKAVVKNGVCAAATTSSYATVTVNPAATAAEYPIKSGTDTKSYTGSPQGVTIEPVSGTGTYTVYYTGTEGTSYTKSSTAPTNVGKYSVTVNAQKGTSYCAADNLPVGTLTITKANQSTAVTISNSGTQCIPSAGGYVDISASGGNTSETITYAVVGDPDDGISLSGKRISATKAGTITVTATRPGGANYNDKTSSNYTFTFVVTPTSVSVTPASPVTHTLPSSVATPSVTQSATATHTGNQNAWTLSPNYSVNTISDASATNPTLTFKREGVYTATVGVGCENTTDASGNSATITVEPPLTIYLSGTLVSSAQDAFGDNNFPMTRTAGSYVYTRRFNAVAGSSAAISSRKFSLRESNSSGQADYLIPKYAKVTYTNVATTGSNNDMYTTDITYSAGNTLEVRAEYKGYNSSENKLEWDISIGLVCDAPDSKTISISSESICRGSDVSVVVNNSQSGYIYTVYDAGNTQVGTTTGDGTNKSISVTRPTESTTYTVKAKQAASCTPTEMANTVSVTINELPTYTPSEGITQYEPVTVTSTATSPAWSFTKVSGSLTGAWLSTTSGTSTVFKAPTGTYTVSDGNCSTGNIVVSNDTETCD